MVAVLVAVAMVAVLIVIAPWRSDASVRQCPDNKTTFAVGRADLCVNGRTVRTRGRIDQDNCFVPVLGGKSYTRAVCTRAFAQDREESEQPPAQYEKIAQALVIEKLHQSKSSASPVDKGVVRIHPGVQWEVRTGVITQQEQQSYGATLTTGRGRADIVNYATSTDDPAHNRMEVWEVKGTWSGASTSNFTSVTNQVQAYTNSFKRDYGWSSATPGTSLIGYSDSFTIADYLQCSDTQKKSQRFTITVPAAGVILVNPVDQPKCDPEEGQSEAEAEAATEAAIEAAESQDDSDDSWSLAHTVEVAVGGTAVTFVVAGVVAGAGAAAKALLAGRTTEICVDVGQFDTTPHYTTVTNATAGCLVGEKAALDAIAAGMSEEEAYLLMMNHLVGLVDAGYISIEALAAILGVSVATAAALVATSRARTSGDPHLITLDGFNYDLQAVGEFVLADIPAAEVTIQARFAATTAALSSVDALAFELGDSLVELASDGSVTRDGDPLTIEDGAGYLVGDEGAYIIRQGGNTLVQWPTGPEGQAVALTWQPNNGVGFVGLSVPSGMAGTVTGLLGDFDGDPKNDLVLRDGTQLASTVSATTIHDGYADSWRITDSESFFTYPAGKSTKDYTDLAFPSSIVTRGDFTADERAWAMSVCKRYGVAAGPSFDDCELDVLATGNWAFAESAAKVSVPSIKGGDAEPDESGYLGEDYEGDIPNNLSAIRIGKDAALTTFAGPFSGIEEYRSYVSELPGHDRVDLSFDLIRFGAWDASDTVRLKVDDRTVAVPLDWSTAVSGTLKNGTEYRRMRVAVPVAHHLSQFALTLSGSGLSGDKLEGFGIDNVAIRINLIPPQDFVVPVTQAVATPLTAAALGDGAGVLETRGSMDRYHLDLPSGSSIYLDTKTWQSSLGWRLLAADGSVLDTGIMVDRDKRIDDLPGAVMLDVFAVGSAPPVTQKYTLSVVWAADPQVFPLGELTDTSSPRASEDRRSIGAGMLETIGAVDEYDFTVPEGGSRVIFDEQVSSYWALWELIDARGQVTVVKPAGSFGPRYDSVLAAGDYALRVSTLENTGYYRLQIYVPPAEQRFHVSVDGGSGVDASEIDRPAGSGSLESWLARDVYVFDTSGGDLVIGSRYGGIDSVLWELRGSSEVLLGSGDLGAQSSFIRDLPAGLYSLVISEDPKSTYEGLFYELNMMMAPDAEVFDLGELSASAPINLQTVGPGAGMLETVASVDEYAFSVPVGQSRVTIDLFSGSGYELDWELVGPAGAVPGIDILADDGPFEADLSPGGYRLRVSTSSRPKSYNFQIYLPQVDQVFPVELTSGVNVIASDADPQSGSGLLETRKSRDIYTITTSGADLLVKFGRYDYVVWELVNSAGETVHARGKEKFSTVTGVPAGDYRLIVSYPATTSMVSSSYQLELAAAVDPDVFDLGTLSPESPIDASDSSLGSGAGVLETMGSIDDYVFSVPTNGARVVIDRPNSHGNNMGYNVVWELTRPDGTTSVIKTSSSKSRFDAELPGGQYRLRVSNAGLAVAYGLQIYIPLLDQVFPVDFAEGSVLLGSVDSDAGSGLLEFWASRDVYDFTATGGDIVVKPMLWDFSLRWELQDSTGATVYAGSGSKVGTITGLNPGDYRIVVSLAPTVAYTTNTYDLELTQAAAPA